MILNRRANSFLKPKIIGEKFIAKEYSEIPREEILKQETENRLKFKQHRERIYSILSFFLLASLYFAKWYLEGN